MGLGHEYFGRRPGEFYTNTQGSDASAEMVRCFLDDAVQN